MESKYDTVAQAALYFALFSAAGTLIVAALLMKTSQALGKLQESFDLLQEKLEQKENTH